MRIIVKPGCFFFAIMIVLILLSPVQLCADLNFSLNEYPPQYWILGKLYSEPLPWSTDQEFQKAIKQNGTFILMAKYQATLVDPLPGEIFNVNIAAKKLAGTVIQDGAVFSQNKKLGPYTSNQGYQSGPMYKGMKVVTSVGGGVCKIASVLYNLVILSNLPVIERHHHGMTVPYVPPGQDATVCYGVKDFRFLNNSGGPVLIWAEMVDHTLFIAFYGRKISPEVTWQHQTIKKILYWKIYKYNKNLPKGSEKVVIPGQNGLIIRSFITIKYPDGKIEVKKMGKSYYDPMPEVIEKGLK
ncbi:VanW family protein [Candidatus Formimonas warabiya]|uniref:G5 domain-containing protein n=1 Tax=Formimonas warabiya TaxID=1761012 RepID=A0A3G1KPF7_FORW1|nr:VanW family protein [Candidatus Formimonas warabiya]ATW24328.1 hypothetical protein DCMF_05575 [Candidatus Formimonas warabiya]